jgi:hypothetical protein
MTRTTARILPSAALRAGPLAALSGALFAALFAALASPLSAQHGGIAATLNVTRYEDRVTGTSASAKGFGFEGIVGGADDGSLYGFASLDFYTVGPGPAVRSFGVLNVGFKIWPNAFEPGLRPWAGGAIGLGGGKRQLSPVLLGGVHWVRKDANGHPFVAAEYATKYQQARFKIGYMLGG